MGKTILKKKFGEAEVEIKVSDTIFKHFTDEEIAEKYKISLEIAKELREQYNKKKKGGFDGNKEIYRS